MTRPKAVPKALLEWTWLALRQVAARHGRTWREKISPSREKLLSDALRTASPHEVVRAIDGFVAVSVDWSDEIREKCWNVEYILRAGLLDKHIENAPVRLSVFEPPAKAPVSAGVEIQEAHELRTLGFYGTVGER